MRWSAQLLSWLSLVFIARLLTPHDYGIVGLVSWFVLLLSYVADFGIGTTVMARRDLAPSILAQLNTVAVAMGTASCILTIIAAPLLATVYNERALIGVMSLLSLTFLCTAFAVIPVAMLQRSLRFRALAVLDFVRAVSTTATVLILATMKFGYWALVFGSLAGALSYAALAVVLSSHRFAWPTWGEVKLPLSHGSYFLSGGIAWAIYANCDFAIVGKVLGVSAAGYYSLAWTLATLPGEKITNVVQSVLRPLFASLQHDAAASRSYFLTANQLLAAVLTPMFVGLALVASDVIPLVLGERWRPAVPIVQILCFYAIGQNLAVMCSNVLFRKADVQRTAAQSACLVLLLPPLFWFVSSRFGILGIPFAWLVVQPLIMILPLHLARRVLGFGVRQYVDRLVPVVVASIVMAAAVYITGTLLGNAVLLLRLPVKVAVGIMFYIAAWQLLYPKQMTSLLYLIRTRTLAGQHP